MGAGTGSTERGEQRHWLEIEEEAPPRSTAPSKKSSLVGVRRWSCVVNAMLTVIVITTPPLVFLLAAGHVGSPAAVWIETAAAGLRQARHGGDSRFLGGLLADGVDQGSCHSRYQSAMYRRHAGRRPSAYLVSKLRRQEALQRRCGPGTAAYAAALEQLRSGRSAASPECRYVVSISYRYRGLGNKILGAASAFLYAVLTGRALLVDPSNEMGELFCEPFPGASWLLPPEFPVAGYSNFSVDTAESYGNMVKNGVVRSDAAADGVSASSHLPAFAYIHLDHDATGDDRLFFCDDDQRLLRRVQWLAMKTDNYIVPGLFLVEAFQEELDMLFPEPDAVFHHLGRYLFHPNNHVWGLVTRYYDAYLAAAERRVGVQVRVFGALPFSPELMEQITTCTQKENLLPEVLPRGASPTSPASRPKSVSVLVTSLKSWYCEKMKGMYWEHAAAGGEAVSVHQPSHEENQLFGAGSHDGKAWAEIYLLSLTDVLVTSGMSTFGYVAQGLGGLRPWVMYKSWNGSAAAAADADPPCGRDVSMEPCFTRPANYDCRLKQGADSGKIAPHVRPCDDVSWGVKLVGRNK